MILHDKKLNTEKKHVFSLARSQTVLLLARTIHPPTLPPSLPLFLLSSFHACLPQYTLTRFDRRQRTPKRTVFTSVFARGGRNQHKLYVFLREACEGGGRKGWEVGAYTLVGMTRQLTHRLNATTSPHRPNARQPGIPEACRVCRSSPTVFQGILGCRTAFVLFSLFAIISGVVGFSPCDFWMI